MKSKQDIISNIRNQINISEVVIEYITLNKKGNNFLGICPFHQDTKPSLSVNDSKKIFKCFSCGVSGDAFSFISKYENISYNQAVLKIAKKNNIDFSSISFLDNINKKDIELSILFEINNKTNYYFNNFLKNKENKYVIDYLYNRGIDDTLIEHFQIGFAPDNSNIIIDLLTNKNNMLMNENLGFKSKDIFDAGISNLNSKGEYISFFFNRITIPILNEENKIIGFGARTINNEEPKYLNTGTTKIFNKSQTLFNINNIINENIDTEILYLVEGYMDVIALHKIGIKNVVATMGVSFNELHFEVLNRLINLKIINICFDNDFAGINSTIKTAEIISKKYSVSIIKYESELKDIDAIIKEDKEKGLETINNVIDFSTFQIELLIKEYSNLGNTNNNKILLEKSMNIIKKEKDIISINNNITILSDLLKIEKQILLSSLNSFQMNKTKKNFNKYESKLEINFNNHQNMQKEQTLIKGTERTEKEILKCIILNRQCLYVFEEKSNVFLDDNNQQIFNKIQEIYDANQSLISIEIEDLKNSFKSDDNLMQIIIDLVIGIDKIKIQSTIERLSKTLENHIKKINNYAYEKKIKNILKNEKDNNKKNKCLEDFIKLKNKN